MDGGDHADGTHTFVRDSSRAIIIADGRIAMMHSLKYGYYKLPGGGVEKGEDPVAALIRETREEAGLIIKPETIREYGYVHRVHKSFSDETERFVQDNYYYLCEAEEDVLPQQLDDYEADEGFTLEFIGPDEAAAQNVRSSAENPFDRIMLERENRVLELLKNEKFFGSPCDMEWIVLPRILL